MSVIRGRLRSRHSSSKTYHIYVSFVLQEVSEWYCTCFMGARTVGCCSHIAALLVYFSTGRKIPEGISKVNYFVNLFQKCKNVVLVDGESDKSDI